MKQTFVFAFLLAGVSFATQAWALVLCTSITSGGALQVREDCHTPEVQINPADLGLDGGFAVYDSHGVRLGKVQGSLDWGASADSRALADAGRWTGTGRQAFVVP